jgi:GrpB-like predicted nucleotidyltransferase (UPF0157 family)
VGAPCGANGWLSATGSGPDPQLAAEYQQLKQDLSERFSDDRLSYAAGKRDFVARVLARSGISLTFNRRAGTG